jgi:hypothetical protein
MSKNTLVDQVESRSESIENDLNARGILTDLEDRFTTKYRLEFGDDYSVFKYRVLIQQRGYVGAILPIIGTNDPVVLQWEGDDDFYEPIKGSQCNLIVEYLPPYKIVDNQYSISSFNKRRYQINPNQFFEYGNTGYVVSEGAIARSYPYKYEDSEFSYRALQTNNFPAVYTEILRTEMVENGENIFFVPNAESEVNIEFVFDSDYTGGGDFIYYFRYALVVSFTDSSTGINYVFSYNDEDNEWQVVGSMNYIEKQIENINAFGLKQDTGISFKMFDWNEDYINRKFNVFVYRPYLTTSSGYNGLYITSIQAQVKDLAANSYHQYKFSQANNSEIYQDEKTSIDHIRGATRTFSGKVYGVDYVRPRNNFLFSPIVENSFTIVTQEINNDFRSNLQRYEGTFKNNFYKPLNMAHKIWVNFGLSVLRLPDTVETNQFKK